ncbi:alpha/beta hydrolase [Planosporangium flavigriseum]|uniref:Acyl-CoA thioester hydrolase n=1 Tax=Planosporangium flavigriseum TaxID=373681 RepID=A0A8J3LRI4_9ACTN|nr:alpha/beta fold hydrolase [Planosporangium flavigriseum]NJC65240.1 alpha/beta hydrolase [Planosporangium flavigriseum]GIG71860.1 acyl-CoA thioester hydrolase [Planosporangium flavigriseum]
MAEVEMRFASADQTLVGSLLLPAGPGPFPAALLITGSGPIDRNSDHKRMPLGVTRQLAEALAARGIASLRYDKRGVGASTGSFLAAGLSDNVTDSRAALDALVARPEIDVNRLFVVGHSEGALIATALAAQEGAPVAGLVLLAGAARTGAEILRWQAAAIAPSLPAPVRALLRLLRTDLVAKSAKTHERLRRTTTDVARIGGRRINAKWFRELLDYDPAADLARLHIPVCAVTGDKDLQVDPDELGRIAAVVPAPVEVHRLPDVTHLLRADEGPASLRTYKKQVRRPVAPEVVQVVTGWLARRVAEVAGPGVTPADAG